MNWLIDHLFSMGAGACLLYIWFRASYYCIDTLGAITCIPHTFNINTIYNGLF